MVRLIPLFAFLLFWTPANSGAQPIRRVDLTEPLARARQAARWPELIRDSLVTPRWLSRGDRLVFWDAIGASAGTWVLVDAATGRRTTPISSVALRAQLAALTGATANVPVQMPFVLTDDDRGLVFRYADKAYRLDFATAAVRQVEDGGIDALVSGGGQVSPRGDRVAVQRGDGFAVVDAAGRTVVVRTGQADLAWVLPDRPWSPDGRLAVWLVDQRDVHRIPIIDHADATERVSLVPYAKVGTPIAKQVLHLFDPASGAATPVRMEPDEGYRWLAGWRGGGGVLVLQWRATASGSICWRSPATARFADCCGRSGATPRSPI